MESNRITSLFTMNRTKSHKWIQSLVQIAVLNEILLFNFFVDAANVPYLNSPTRNVLISQVFLFWETHNFLDIADFLLYS